MRIYNDESRFGTKVKARIDAPDVYVLSVGAALTTDQARKLARAILVLCANAERSRK
jgi:hypothetical protein